MDSTFVGRFLIVAERLRWCIDSAIHEATRKKKGKRNQQEQDRLMLVKDRGKVLFSSTQLEVSVVMQGSHVPEVSYAYRSSSGTS